MFVRTQTRTTHIFHTEFSAACYLRTQRPRTGSSWGSPACICEAAVWTAPRLRAGWPRSCPRRFLDLQEWSPNVGNRPSRAGCSNLATPMIGRSEKAFRIRSFMSKFLGVSLFSSASKKGRTWEHGAGTLCKFLSSHSFSERLKRSEKAFRKRRFISKLFRVFFVSEAKRNVSGNTRHVPPKTPFLKFLFRTPEMNVMSGISSNVHCTSCTKCSLSIRWL